MPGKSMRTIGCCATQTILAVVILTSAPPSLHGQSFFRQQDLFISGHDDVNIYRIPSLIVSPQGTILAFCEARQGDDGDPTDLVLKRSLYHGTVSYTHLTLPTKA